MVSQTPPNTEIDDPGPICEVAFYQNFFANFQMEFSTPSNVLFCRAATMTPENSALSQSSARTMCE